MNLYPEVKPEGRPSHLPLSLENVQAARQETERLLEQYRNMVDKLGSKSTIQGVNIVDWLIKSKASKKEILTLAKALEKLASLAEVVKLLEGRLATLDHATNDAFWFTTAFADTEQAVEDAIASIDKLTLPD